MTNSKSITEEQLKTDLPDIQSGDTVEVHQILKEVSKKDKKEIKERIQVFKGLVIAKKHGKGINATITVRRIFDKIGVEKIFPIHSPLISKIKIINRAKVRRSKLYYLRALKGKKARLKKKDLSITAKLIKSKPVKTPSSEIKEPIPSKEKENDKQEVKKIKKIDKQEK